MNKTKIDWCDATVNPVVGCKMGCPYCYAKTMNDRFKWVDDFGEPQFRPEQLKKLQCKKPKTIFVGSMCDLFGEWVPDEWIKAVFAACEAAPQHRYLFLTKNSDRYIDLPEEILNSENYWFGQTITDNETVKIASIKINIFWSIEPILEPVDLEIAPPNYAGVKWVIIGAETGRRKGKITPKREWIERIVVQCAKANVPVFMKSNLADIWGEPLIQQYGWEVEK